MVHSYILLKSGHTPARPWEKRWMFVTEADRFYLQLIPQARELTATAAHDGRLTEAEAVNRIIDAILAHPEHRWFKEGAEEQTERVRREMERRYGQDDRGS